MGVDYDSVGGIGIEITDEMIERLIQLNFIDQEEWDDDYSYVLDKLGIIYGEGGSHSYGGPRRLYWFVDGTTLDKINEKAGEFINKVNEFGFGISLSDLKLIEDIHTW